MRLLAQAAVDFMMSYGIALIIIFIALSVIYKITILTPIFATSSCTPSSGFSCEAYAIDSNGILTIQLSQATGGTLIIRGFACSTQVNNTGNRPAFGNFNVINSIVYYPAPNNAPTNPITFYSGTSQIMYLYCYTSVGKAATALGTPFTGYLWLNYSVPSYGNLTQEVATLNLRHT